MTDRVAPDVGAAAGAADDANADVLRQAIAHVDQLLHRLDHEPASPSAGGEAGVASPGADVAPAVQLAAALAQLTGPPAAQARAREHATQLIMQVRAAAERVREQAHRASLDAAVRGRQLVSDAVRAAADLQADAERSWSEREAWASAQSRAADDAIRTLLAGSAPATDGLRVGIMVDADLERAVDATVRELETLRAERHWWLEDRF